MSFLPNGSPRPSTRKGEGTVNGKDAGGPDSESVAAPLSWRRAFGGSFIAFALLAAATGTLVYVLKGEAAVLGALHEQYELLFFLIPRVGGALLMAAFLQTLVPRAVVSRLIGARAGFRGVMIAAAAGALTPGGPLTSFPIVVALYAAGANRGALVAYITAWAMLGVQRVLVWEFPLMGAHFTGLRLAASVALPVIAGAIALRLPLRMRPHPAAAGEP